MSGRRDLEQLLKIINLCDTVEKSDTDPFEVDVTRTLEVIKRFLSKWKETEELSLDVETLRKISTVVKLQGDWLKFRSSSLYADPFLIELKLRILDVKALAECLAKAWRPIVTLEQMTPRKIKEAMDYWNTLPTLMERRRENKVPVTEPGLLTMDDLINMDLMTRKEFDHELQSLWEELKKATKDQGKISYWDFIYREDYQKTVERAYLTSFLVTYGYASMELKPLEDEIYLRGFPEQRTDFDDKKAVSVPISVDYERWQRLGGKKDE